MLEKIKNIFNSQLYALSLYARQIAGTVILFVIARYLSVYDYGLFSSYKSIAGFCLLFANLGFADYILVSSQVKVMEVRLKISLFLSNAMFLLFLTIFCSLFFKMSNNFLFCLVAIRTFLDSIFFALILPYFQATKKFNTIAVINILYSIGITIIATAAYVFKLSLTNFLYLNILLGLINFIQCSFYAKINYFLYLTHIKQFLKKIDKSILGYAGVTIAFLLYAQIPALYVSTFIEKEQAALFFAANTIAAVISLLIAAQTQKMVPEMIKATVEQVKTILKKNLYFILGVTGCVFLFIIIFGKILLKLLYGQDYYTNAYPVLLILMLGNILVAEAAVYGAYITASGNQHKKIPMQLEATVITFVSLFVFHKFGIIGAGVSFLLAANYIAIRYTLKTKQLLKNDTN